MQDGPEGPEAVLDTHPFRRGGGSFYWGPATAPQGALWAERGPEPRPRAAPQDETDMDKRGLIHIYTGDGKGKTTAAAGLAVRAAGSGQRVLFVQFFKEDSAESGEKTFFRERAPDLVRVLRSNCRHPFFTGKATDEEGLRRAIRETFEMVRDEVGRGGVDLLVLDEIMAVLNGGWLEMEELRSFLEGRPEGLEVVLTGRNAPSELVSMADYVTEMLKIKHPFDRGRGARRGIDF